MKLHWCTADHCGGVYYGPYPRKYAFVIQRTMSGFNVCDRQDVFLILWIGKRAIRLLTFKCKGKAE